MLASSAMHFASQPRRLRKNYGFLHAVRVCRACIAVERQEEIEKTGRLWGGGSGSRGLDDTAGGRYRGPGMEDLFALVDLTPWETFTSPYRSP